MKLIYRLFYLALLTITLAACGSGSSDSAASDGQGGSMARFALVDNYLYTINRSRIQIFDVSNEATPQIFATVWVDFGIETLFVAKGFLAIGGQRGIYLYDISVPSNPKRISEFTHAQSCDPVVVSGDYAYVTLRDGNTCGGASINTLEVISLVNIEAPDLVDSIAMLNPKGLGVDEVNKRLYVCDDRAGLKVFDLTDPASPVLFDGMVESSVNCLDVIVTSENRMVVSNDTSIIQYALAELPLVKLSEITGFTPPLK